MGEITPLQVAKAWHSVKDEWFVRLYKGKTRPWQVCVQRASDDDVNPQVVGSFLSQETANRRRDRLENEARGAAVLAAVKAGEDRNG